MLNGGFLNIIRIYQRHESDKKSIPRIIIWHQEACRVMTNDPDGQISHVKSQVFLNCLQENILNLGKPLIGKPQ